MFIANDLWTQGGDTIWDSLHLENQTNFVDRKQTDNYKNDFNSAAHCQTSSTSSFLRNHYLVALAELDGSSLRLKVFATSKKIDVSSDSRVSLR